MFKKRNQLARQVFFAAFLMFVVISSACFSRLKTAPTEPETQPDSSEKTFDVPPPNFDAIKPLESSTDAKDQALCEQINQTIESSEFANARWGIAVVSLKDGRAVCARDARKLFNPASIEKTLTAIVALDKLGADFRWQTKIYAKSKIENGNLNGDLTIYGTGAPDFDAANLENLANQLQAQGLKHIGGNIVGDDSFFAGDEIGDGWTWNDLQWYYGAEASALSFKENQAEVFMSDGKPAASTDFFHVDGELKSKANGEIDAFGVKRGLENNEVHIWGYGDKGAGRLSVHNPALWTATNLKDLLVKKGIAVDGDAKSIDWKSPEKLDAANAVELASVDSKTLGEIVTRMDKHSVNLYGELLLRLLGKKFGDEAPDESRQISEIRGDDAAGAAVVKKFLKDNKVVTDEIQIHDGSGLSRLDFVSPEAFVRALAYAAQSKFADVFVQSLPIAATDGTLGGRLQRVKGKILAKTGSITYVNSLAGYAQASENEIYAFAIISNNITRKSDSSRIIDQIAARLVDVQKQQNKGKSEGESNSNSIDRKTKTRTANE